MIEIETQTSINPAAVLPRVDLIPASIHERHRIARTRRVAAALVAGSFAITGGLWVLAHQSVATAQSRVDQANATNTSLQAQAAKYALVPQIQSQLDGARAQLAGAMQSDIRFSYLLNDLSLTIPANVALTQLTISTAGSSTTGTSGLLTSPTATGPLATGIGSITFQGTATSINAVAGWLDKGLANSPAYANPFVTNVGNPTQQTGTTGSTVFTSSLILTPSAFSHRFDQGVN